jgi:hypothetical protein
LLAWQNLLTYCKTLIFNGYTKMYSFLLFAYPSTWNHTQV